MNQKKNHKQNSYKALKTATRKSFKNMVRSVPALAHFHWKDFRFYYCISTAFELSDQWDKKKITYILETEH